MITPSQASPLSTIAVVLSLALGGCDRGSSPFAHLLPDNPPTETHRVAHPAGYSLVFPAGWKTEMQSFPDGYFADGLSTASRDSFGNEDFDKPNFSVLRFSDQGRGAIQTGSYIDRMSPAQFQNQPAWESFEPGRLPDSSSGNLFRDSSAGYPYLTQSVLLERSGEWFLLSFQMRNIDGKEGPFLTEPAAIIQQYFETFEFQPRGAN
jgi:hypothetical protein